MTTQMHTTSTTHKPGNQASHQYSAKTSDKKTGSKASRMPTFGGISLVEIAVLGAGGYVLWKNRSKVQTILENNGIEVPAIVSADFSDLLRSGAKALSVGNSHKDDQKTVRGITSHDAKLDG